MDDPAAGDAPEIVLIGPVGAGKSTVGALLGECLHLPWISLDGIANSYYEDYGLGPAAFDLLVAEQGFLSAYRRWWPALAYATERGLAEYPQGGLDLGAGHSHYEDTDLFERVRQGLAKCRNVVLLLPSPDLDRSVHLLRERSVKERGWDWVADGYDFIEHWVKDRCNHDLAAFTVYTEGKTPAETCEEIVRRRSSAQPGSVCGPSPSGVRKNAVA